MEVLCRESYSQQINIYVTSVRFSGGTDAMIFNYRSLMWHISSRSIAKVSLVKAAINQGLISNGATNKTNTCARVFSVHNPINP